MRVEDAVAQLSISSKRAAVTVKKVQLISITVVRNILVNFFFLNIVVYCLLKVIHAAASNGVNNHGLVKEKLLVGMLTSFAARIIVHFYSKLTSPLL